MVTFAVDNDEPITAAWLDKVGFCYEQDRDTWYWSGVELTSKVGGDWRINMGDCWEYFPDQTRGTIRILCAALGKDLLA
jgi:hypothetical protein